jgi:hypothetical protein
MGKKALRVPAVVLVNVIALLFLYPAPAAVDKKDPGNMLLVVEAADKRAELPLGKNVMRIIGKTETSHTLEGVTVLATRDRHRLHSHTGSRDL